MGTSLHHQIHNDFLSQFFYSQPDIYMTGIKTKYIIGLYDTENNKKYEGPFDNLNSDNEEIQSEGVNVFTELIELDQENAIAYFNRGLAKAPFDCAGAIADFTKAIEIDPTYKEAYRYRGLAKKKIGEDGEEDILISRQL
ncbi:hypothetical protein I5M32_16235 [Pedobacter sp. SD-b]|uniref:Tetratricopeptide repeat-containing protein n=1 Tax=Pedobacter segetis TaxID=2793069 RepID=A0ABS1BP30_9SPHI|nr:hypothetical protein [Pedobacter segetis]MBK0384516.1 hypothetical protein [Pedobacter segetis]